MQYATYIFDTITYISIYFFCVWVALPQHPPTANYSAAVVSFAQVSTTQIFFRKCQNLVSEFLLLTLTPTPLQQLKKKHFAVH